MRKALLILALVLLAGFIYRSSVFRPAQNFHVVDEGRFYRMAQPTPDELEQAVKEYGIKTVINLRGHQPGEWWYDDESAATARLGLKQIDLGFSTEHVQHKVDWVAYIDALKTAERPILVHCRSGADRTSEASAVYEIEYMKKTPQEAIDDQMTLANLHVALFLPAKRGFIAGYKGADWVRSTYDECLPEFRKWSNQRCLR